MSRTVPDAIMKQRNAWSMQARFLRIGYAVLVGVAVVSAMLAAAKLGLEEIHIRLLAFLAAVCTGLLSSFDLGSKSNRMRNAWRMLNTAVMRFEVDPTCSEADLLKAYEKAEEMIGGVKEQLEIPKG